MNIDTQIGTVVIDESVCLNYVRVADLEWSRDEDE